MAINKILAILIWIICYFYIFAYNQYQDGLSIKKWNGAIVRLFDAVTLPQVAERIALNKNQVERKFELNEKALHAVALPVVVTNRVILLELMDKGKEASEERKRLLNMWHMTMTIERIDENEK